MREYSAEQIYKFLCEVDKYFPVPLSEKQELWSYSQKLSQKATICAFCENGEIVSMVAGYTDNVTDNLAYVAIVATVVQARGRGLAATLLQEFLSVCTRKKIRAVHLYAVPTNVSAVRLYKKLGFVSWRIENESRPGDEHLIYYLGE